MSDPGGSSRSGIDSMPVELLQEIFILSLPEAGEPQYPPQLPKFDTSALCIAAVSKAWRSIALLLPELWATMLVYNPSSRAVELVQLYLSRSGEAVPLSLRLVQYHYLRPPGESEDKENAEEARNTKNIIDLWFPRLERWECFYLTLDDLPSVLTGISPESLGNLKEFGFNSMSNSTGLVKLWDTIHAAPNLRAVFWGHLPWEYTPSASLKQLTRITMHAVRPDDLQEILRLPQLEHLTLLTLQSEPQTPKIVVAPRLQILHIYTPTFPKALAIFFDHLSAPSLNELVLCSATGGLPIDTLKKFLARSKCTLRKILLRQIRHHDAFGILLAADRGDNGFGYLDGLEKLICQCSVNWSLLEPYNDPGTGLLRVPFPSLVNFEAPSDYRDGLIGKVLLSREAAGAGLWTLNLERAYYSGTGDDEEQPENCAAFRELEGRGLKLHINEI